MGFFDSMGGLGGLLGGLVGGAAGASDASSNNALAGHVDLTNSQQTNPWGPASPYLQGLMQLAYGSLGPGSASWGQLNPQGQGSPSFGGPSGPGAPPGGPGPGGANPPGASPYGPGTIYQGGVQTGGGHYVGNGARALSAPGPSGLGSAPSGGTPPAAGPGFNGTSPQSQQAIDQLLAIAQQGGGPLQGQEQGFVGQYLQGQDPNAYRSTTFGADQALAQSGDPRLNAFLASLSAGQMPGSPGAQDPGAGGMPTTGMMGGGISINMGPQAPPPVAGEADFISKILAEGQDKYQANPALQQMEDAATAGIKRQFASQVIPGITSASVGSGLMGGSAWQDAMAKAANEETSALGNAIAPLAYQGYSDQMARQMQAAGLGAQLNENAATNETSRANAAMQAQASGSASMANANLQYQLGLRQLTQQGQLARMQAMLSGIGMGNEVQQYGLGQMGSLAQGYGQEQLGAGQLGSAIERIPGEQMALAAQAAQAGVTGQNQYLSSQNQLRAALAQVSAENARTRLSQQEFYDPLTRLGDVSTIIGGLSRPYGSSTSTQQGTDYRNLPRQNVAGQGLAGALGGMGLGNQLGNLLGGLGGGGLGGGGGISPNPNSPTGYSDAAGNPVDPYAGGSPYDNLSGATGANPGDPGYGVIAAPNDPYAGGDPWQGFDPTGGYT